MENEKRNVELQGEEIVISQRNVVQNLTCSNKLKNLKALEFSKNAFNTLDNQTSIKIIGVLPGFLRNNSPEVVEITLDLIFMIYNKNLQKYLNIKECIFNILEKSLLLQKRTVINKCDLALETFLQNLESKQILILQTELFSSPYPQIVTSAFKFLTLVLKEFGVKQLNNLKEIFPIFEQLGQNQEYKKDIIQVFKEIYKYMGKKFEENFKGLTKEEQIELKMFQQTWGNVKLKGKRDQIKTHENKIVVDDFWLKYNESWALKFQKKIHWEDKLEELKILQNDFQHKIEKGNYYPILNILYDCMNDANLQVQIQAMECMFLLIKINQRHFKEMRELITFLTPFYRKKNEKLTIILNEIFIEVIAQQNLLIFLDNFKQVMKSKNALYKMNILNILVQIVNLKNQQGRFDELKQFAEKFEITFKRIEIDKIPNIRQQGKILKKQLVKFLQQNSDSLQVKVKQRLSNLYQIQVPQEIPQELTHQQTINSQRNLEQNKPQSPFKILNHKTSMPFEPIRKMTKTELQTQQSFLKNQRLRSSTNNFGTTKNFFNNEIERIDDDFDISDYEGGIKELLRRKSSKQPQNLQIPQLFKNNIAGFDDKLDLIDWNQKDKKKLLKDIYDFLEKTELTAQESNYYLDKIQLLSKDFSELINTPLFDQFCIFLTTSQHIFINQTTFVIFKPVLIRDLTKNKKCTFSFGFLEKLLISIGPYQFFELILNYVFKKGFNHKNFVYILYQLVRRIPPSLLFDGHLILLHRNLQLFYSNMEILQDFTNLIHSILQQKIFYLRKAFPELIYIDFTDTLPVPIVEYLNFSQEIFEEMKKITTNFLGSDIPHYKANDITKEIKELIRYSKINPNKKKQTLEKMMIILLKNAKFMFTKKSIDSKIQTLWVDILAGNETNKIILKNLSKIIFLYSHCNESNDFQFQQKLIKSFINIFLKEKNNEIRKHFSFALRRHFLQVNLNQVHFFCQLLEQKNQEMRQELLDILFEYFDNQPEENILKIDKSKVFPYIFSILKERDENLKNKSREFLEFLMTFFKENEMKKMAKKHSQIAYEFVNNFFLHTSNQNIGAPNLENENENNQKYISSFNINSQSDEHQTSNQNAFETPQKILKNFIFLEELKTLQLPQIIEDLEKTIEKVFIFQISELFRGILYEGKLTEIDQMVEILHQLMQGEMILNHNVIPLILSILFNLLTNHNKNELVQQNVFDILISFIDSLKVSAEVITPLMNEEFSLFLEIISLFEFLNKDDICQFDYLIQTVIIDHIEVEDQIAVLGLFEEKEQKSWLITCLPQEEIQSDLLKNLSDYKVSIFDQLFFNIAFGTENSILDILITNKYFNKLQKEEKKESLLIFLILFKRIKKTLIFSDYFNEKFLSFLIEKIQETLKDFYEQSEISQLAEFFQIQIELLHQEPTHMNLKILNFLNQVINSISKMKLVQTFSAIHLSNSNEILFLNSLLVKNLEGESTDKLISYTRDLGKQNNLNQIGGYLAGIPQQKSEIENNIKELPQLEQLLEEYNNFKWE